MFASPELLRFHRGEGQEFLSIRPVLVREIFKAEVLKGFDFKASLAHGAPEDILIKQVDQIREPVPPFRGGDFPGIEDSGPSITAGFSIVVLIPVLPIVAQA